MPFSLCLIPQQNLAGQSKLKYRRILWGARKGLFSRRWQREFGTCQPLYLASPTEPGATAPTLAGFLAVRLAEFMMVLFCEKLNLVYSCRRRVQWKDVK